METVTHKLQEVDRPSELTAAVCHKSHHLTCHSLLSSPLQAAADRPIICSSTAWCWLFSENRKSPFEVFIMRNDAATLCLLLHEGTKCFLNGKIEQWRELTTLMVLNGQRWPDACLSIFVRFYVLLYPQCYDEMMRSDLSCRVFDLCNPKLPSGISVFYSSAALSVFFLNKREILNRSLNQIQALPQLPADADCCRVVCSCGCLMIEMSSDVPC